MSSIHHNTQARRSLIWLDDAPLFIDAPKVNRFYDAVVQPLYHEGKKVVEVSEASAKEIAAKLGLEAELEPGGVIKLLKAFLDGTLTASGEVSGQYQATKSSSETVELISISTPERQLKQLVTHYLSNHQERLFLVPDAQEPVWRSPETILEVPRALVFLNLPGKKEAEESGRPESKLIPTAAEFEDGAVIPLFLSLTRPNGERPPRYPERGQTASELQESRKAYWQWYEESFSPTKAMLVIEEAASVHGRIRWIDYRVPLTHEGDTLHLHICPDEQYHTGDFAYNFVKRGFKHGLRLVGTLKSEPDMNVLAVYEK